MIVTLDDGATTHVERWGSAGPVMLCVHGMTSSRFSWKRLARAFEDRFQVIAYDQRGHGDSAAILGPMTLERGVRDLINVAAAVGLPDVLVGHSWGGAVAIRAGMQLPVRAVVAIDPMIVQVDRDWYDEYVVELRESFQLHDDARDRATRADYAAWHADDVDGKVHAVHSMTVKPIERLRDENPPESWDLRPDIASYERPLLLAMADPDESIVPKAAFEAMTAAHPASVDINIFHNQGHNLHRTAFNDFIPAMSGFLSTHLAQSVTNVSPQA